MTPSETRTLIDAISDGNHLRLVEHEIAGLLSWLAGSSSGRVARALKQTFDSPGRDARATERAFRLLDHALFDHQALREDKAGVGRDRSRDERRRRYRLLLSAFHPDRYPDRADWLTERSQIITIAYSRFKADKGVVAQASTPAAKAGPITVRRPPRRRLRTPKRWLGRLAMGLRRRFGGDPWLGHKIIGCFALVLLLPLISVFLDYKGQGMNGGGAEVSVPRGQTTTNGDLPEMGVGGEGAQGSGLGVQGSGDERLMADAGGDEGVGRGAKGLRGEGVNGLRGEDAGRRAQGDGAQGAGLGVQGSGEERLMADAGVDRGVGGETDTEAAGGFAAVAERAVVQRAPAAQRPAESRGETSAAEPVAAAATTPIPTDSTRREAGLASAPELALATVDRVAPGGATEESAPRAEAIERGRPKARGRLLLGPLGTHQIGSFIQQYQLALEQAEFDALVQLLGPSQAQELRERFPGIFESGQPHRVDLNVLKSQRDGDQWVVQLEQEIGLSEAGRRTQGISDQAKFRFRTDTTETRFVALDF
jgi:hypothetical protein